MSEIRSYRRVFHLERRIYAIDRLRLNPSGIPVRGIVYSVALAFAIAALSRLPIVGRPLLATPWFVRDLLFPAALGALLSMIRVEGRSSHAALGAAVSFGRGPRRLAAMRSTGALEARWFPGALFTLPGGVEHDGLRRLRYRGPGTVLLAAPHEPIGGRRLTLSKARRGCARRIAVRAALVEHTVGMATPPRAISLGRGMTVVFVPAPERPR